MKLLLLASLGAGALLAADCAALAQRGFGKHVTISSATSVPTNENLPAHCDVRGVIWPEAKFALKLPSAWNERFQMVGNGGTAGTISMGAVDSALRKGFAAVSTDTGHDAAKEPLASFAWTSPENPHGRRKLLDFAYLAVHHTAVTAKQIVAAYYGKPARYSYWVGCSTGGRQGMQEAQRYPEDFDGYVIGAPGMFLTGNVMRRIWTGQAQKGAAALPPEKLPALAQAVMAKCDILDGLADGIIGDPRACSFDPRRDLPPGEYTPAQIDGLARIYGGVRNSAGQILFPGEPPGAESVWADNVIGPSKLVLPRAESQMKFYALHPPPGPTWTFDRFDFDRDPARLGRAAKIMNPLNPDLSKLEKRGGKIIHYSGWADQQVNPYPAIDYYEKVSARRGAEATRAFYRLYMIPGMFHCGNGPGCGSVDWLAAVMAWVEKGEAPDHLTGAHLTNGQADRTRPLCAWPQLARYRGTGDPNRAENFSCDAPAR